MSYGGNCRLGDPFLSRREKGRPGLPTLSVTLNDGLVNREDLDRKQETSLSPEEHLLVKPGDIAYNMMRMWQGAFGLAESEGLVSPAYVVLRPTERIYPGYAAHLLRTPRMRYLLWAYSYGLTDDRLRLYFDDFAVIRVTVPSFSRQTYVAQALNTWKSAISVVEQLIENAKRQKQAMLRRLIPAHLQNVSHHGLNVIRLGDIATINPPKPKRPSDGRVSFLPMEAVSEDGRITRRVIRAYDEVCTGYSGFADGDLLVAKITPCFENGKGALVHHLENGVGFGSTEFIVVRPSGVLDSHLLAQVLRSESFRRKGEFEMEGSAGQKRVSSDFVRSFRFLIPESLNAQRELGDLLDSADRIVEAYQQFLNTLKRESQGMAQRLFADDGWASQ